MKQKRENYVIDYTCKKLDSIFEDKYYIRIKT
jgi:hypothetical protein